MKFFKKAEYILPSWVLVFGLVWVVFSEAINTPGYLTSAVFTNPDTYQDAFFVVAVSLLLFIILRNHRLKYVQSEKEIRKLSQVAENAGNGVIILDHEGRIEWVNEAFTALWGYSWKT
jgi:PAS domain-containing protein